MHETEDSDDEDFDDSENTANTEALEATEESMRSQMLESHAQGVAGMSLWFVTMQILIGVDNNPTQNEDEFDSSPLGRTLFDMLKQVMNPTPEIQECYTRIKKDIFHAFHMIPLPSSHGLRAVFLRTLRDHMMRWDPTIRAKVDKTCRRVFKISFEVMLLRNPHWIKKRTPRYIPRPSILVPAIQHVFNVFGNARDAVSGQPLFSKLAWQKANAVVDLAREGYLSDLDDVVVYEKAGIDQYELDLWNSIRGTNKLEGGPHGDIYRKFAALHGELYPKVIFWYLILQQLRHA